MNDEGMSAEHARCLARGRIDDLQKLRQQTAATVREREMLEALLREPKEPAPIPMRIRCPGRLPGGAVCGELHVDEGEFATKPHHTHACQFCGHVWRPAVVPTVGVRFLPGFKNEP